MKREIKFRAWDKENKKMAQVSRINFGPGGIRYLVDDSVLLEYTGLHDKNGREIYEGDVLDIGLRNQDGKPVIAPVSYETYAAGYVLDNGGNGIWQRLTKDCEVIGNIFENPELLEGKQ